jgi:hypothetical protein
MATPSSPRLTILGLSHSAQGASDRTLTEVIAAEGLLIGPEQREKAMRGALQAATDLRVV